MPKRSSPQAGLPERTCPSCKKSFTPYREHQVTCGSRKCRESRPEIVTRIREYHARPEVRERKNAARRTDGPRSEVTRATNLRSNLRRYGLTVEQYEALREAQANRCAICGRPPNPNGKGASARLHIDHDHTSGSVRELLCNQCNQGLGYLRDDPALLRAAAEYIERHR